MCAASSGSLSSRRPLFSSQFTQEQQDRFVEQVKKSKLILKSDASFLPRSTNKGAIPRPVSTKPAAKQGSRTNRLSPHSFEENETEARLSPTIPSKIMNAKKAAFKKVIPCLYVSNIQAALPFYKHMLGFTPVSKPDTMKAHLRSKGSDEGEEGIEIYLRTPPLGSDGARCSLATTSLWISVEDVDDLYLEITTLQHKYQPKADEYFPEHNFGSAKIEGKPQNKAWGSREMIAIDPDGNKLIFFQDL